MVGFPPRMLDYVHIVKYLPRFFFTVHLTFYRHIPDALFFFFFFFSGHINNVRNSDDHKESTTLARSVHGFMKSLLMQAEV